MESDPSSVFHITPLKYTLLGKRKRNQGPIQDMKILNFVLWYEKQRAHIVNLDCINVHLS